MSYQLKRIILWTSIVGGIILLYLMLRHYISLAWIQEQSAYFSTYTQAHYIAAPFIFILAYCGLIATGIPLTGPLSILGGYLFGTILGGLYSLGASVIGVMGLYYIFTYYLNSLLPNRSGQFTRFQTALEQYGTSYLLILQFLLVVPYIIITAVAVMGHISPLTFLWTTILGSLPATFIYAYAGHQLSSITSLRSIISVPVIIALGLLILLACIPIIIRKIQQRMPTKKNESYNSYDSFSHDEFE